MKKLLAFIALASCATGSVSGNGMNVKLPDDFSTKEDSLLICGYLVKHKTLVCMTPEEYQFRVEHSEEQ